MTPPLRRGHVASALLILLAGAAGCLAPRPASATAAVAAVRGTPSSLSGRYGAAVPMGPGRYLVPTRTGFEIRQTALASGDSLVATFRAGGRIDEAAVSGTTAWLAAGGRGLLAVSLATPEAPVLAGSYGDLGTILHVAAAPAGGVLAAATDSTLFVFRDSGGPVPALIDSRIWLDGRQVEHIAASGDSFLVAAVRPGPVPRLFLTLLRVPAASPPESLWDFQANGHLALALAWIGGTAYLADGNTGVLPFHLPTRQLLPPVSLSGNRFVLGLDADDSVLVAVAGGNVLARFARGGVMGDSLTGETDVALPFSPTAVRLVGGHAIVSCDSENEPPEPDEIGRSVVQDYDLSAASLGPAIGATGRVRRVVLDGGLAYVADYTGGLRIYHGGFADSSLVGTLAPLPGARTYDLALDTVRRYAYLASGSGGVEVVDVSDSTAPLRVATAPLPGLARCVAVIGDTLLAAGWNSGPTTGGVTFLDVTSASTPSSRGSVSAGPLLTTIRDPRALASRDTVLFVADAQSGVISVMFGNPDAPTIPGIASGVLGTQDLDLLGTSLLVASSSGVRVVDASSPTRLVAGANVPLPAVYGVTQQGSAAVAFLGDGGVVVIDLSNQFEAAVRGIIDSPGFPRDGAWSGNALLVASSYGLERFDLPATLPSETPLSLSYDVAGTLPRVTATWSTVALSGLTGFNLYREPASVGAAVDALPLRVNGPLLPPTAVSYRDDTLPGAGSFRYRLKAVLTDGSERELAVGTVFVNSNAQLGRPYPNPFHAVAGLYLTIPFQSQPASGEPVRVRIYDVQGRLVRTMTEPAPASGGFASVLWDGRDERGVRVASGVYLVHVRAPGIDDAKSVVLLR